MHKRFSRTTLALVLLTAFGGACSHADSPSQTTSANTFGSADGAQNGTTSQASELPPINPQAPAFLEVSFTIKGTGQGAAEVPFEIRWEEDGKPSSTSARTTPDGTRRIEFEHGSRLVALVIHPSARTAPSVYRESALLMGGRTHKIHVELDAGGVVSGVVLDGAGKLVADAEVGAFFNDAEGLDNDMSPRVDAFTHSDAQGRFRLGGLPSGPFVIEASSPGLVAVWRPVGLMSNAREFSDLEVLLEPGHVVYGQAMDSNENGVADVLITAGKPYRRVNRRPTQYPEVFMNGPRACLARTDADGLFTLQAVPDSQSWNINTKHPRFLPLRTSFDAGQTDVWLQLLEGVALTGSVHDVRGQAIAGAQIWLLSTSGQNSVFSDKNGDFLFPASDQQRDVAPLIYKQGYGMAFLPPMDVTAETLPLAIVLDGGVTLRGKVVDATGTAVSGVSVRVAGNLPVEGYLAALMPERFLDRDAVLTAADGTFEFQELYDSVFTITARVAGQEAVSLEGVSKTSAAIVLTLK